MPRGPGIPAGARAAGNIYLLDLLGTFCDLARIPPPETNEGLSFKAVLEGKQSTVRDVLYGVYCGGTKPGMRSVRKGDWKLVKYDTMNGQVHETQLFNLAENPSKRPPRPKEHKRPYRQDWRPEFLNSKTGRLSSLCGRPRWKSGLFRPFPAYSGLLRIPQIKLGKAARGRLEKQQSCITRCLGRTLFVPPPPGESSIQVPLAHRLLIGEYA